MNLPLVQVALLEDGNHGLDQVDVLLGLAAVHVERNALKELLGIEDLVQHANAYL